MKDKIVLIIIAITVGIFIATIIWGFKILIF
jgi:hypothetical protein